MPQFARWSPRANHPLEQPLLCVSAGRDSERIRFNYHVAREMLGVREHRSSHDTLRVYRVRVNSNVFLSVVPCSSQTFFTTICNVVREPIVDSPERYGEIAQTRDWKFDRQEIGGKTANRRASSTEREGKA